MKDNIPSSRRRAFLRRSAAAIVAAFPGGSTLTAFAAEDRTTSPLRSVSEYRAGAQVYRTAIADLARLPSMLAATASDIAQLLTIADRAARGLDQRQSAGRITAPRSTGLRWQKRISRADSASSRTLRSHAPPHYRNRSEPVPVVVFARIDAPIRIGLTEAASDPVSSRASRFGLDSTRRGATSSTSCSADHALGERTIARTECRGWPLARANRVVGVG